MSDINIKMNVFDKALSYFSPIKAGKNAMAREFLNSGYGDSGASKKKNSLKGMLGTSVTPIDDIDKHTGTLVQRSRSLFMGSAIARGAINTNSVNVVGEGLKLKPRIDYKLLGITKEQAREWESRTKKEFLIWAESKHCDTLKLNNFYELQQLAFCSWLLNGDGFCILEQDKISNFMPYALRLHLIESDRVYNPTNSRANYDGILNKTNAAKKPDNQVISGIEVDKKGAVLAYYVSSHYRGTTVKDAKFTRIEAFGKKTGNPNILHLMVAERCEQYRGVPYIAPVIEELKQISRFTEAELVAAVVQSFYTVFIKQNGNRADNPFGEQIQEYERIDDIDPSTYEMGAGTVNVLGVDEDVVFADSKRPSQAFDGFVFAIIKQIGTALNIPGEVLLKTFNSSYSASRAALLEAWKAFRMKRHWFVNDFCKPVYDLWLSEAIARGRVKAPGYFTNPLIAKAWQGAEWIGPAPGQIDPVKEVNAAKLRVENGFSTREREANELNGSDFDSNIAQIATENEKMREANPVVEGDINNAENE